MGNLLSPETGLHCAAVEPRKTSPYATAATRGSDLQRSKPWACLVFLDEGTEEG